tara:strand:- start:193 stop:714 length:522 start_codon:yes stop_codon:yes gene_type:complete
VNVMGAKGNRFWELRSSHGRKPIFASSKDLWKCSTEYFEWCEDNPLYETKAFAFQGVVTTEELPKMRAMTVMGLCLFLDISQETLSDYAKKDGFIGVVASIKNIIRDQKFSGAAADLLNANIIARDLGLKDKSDVDHSSSDGSMTPKETKIITADMNQEDATRIYQDMINGKV